MAMHGLFVEKGLNQKNERDDERDDEEKLVHLPKERKELVMTDGNCDRCGKSIDICDGSVCRDCEIAHLEKRIGEQSKEIISLRKQIAKAKERVCCICGVDHTKVKGIVGLCCQYVCNDCVRNKAIVDKKPVDFFTIGGKRFAVIPW